MHFYMHAKVTEFANLLHYEFVGTTTRDPASLSNRLYPAEAGKKCALLGVRKVLKQLSDYHVFKIPHKKCAFLSVIKVTKYLPSFKCDQYD